MPKKSEPSRWIVVRAARPFYLSTPVPSEVGDIIGIPKRKLGAMPRHARFVFFMDRGPLVVRVASVLSSLQLYEEGTRKGEVLDTAQVTTNNHFYIPLSIQSHLGMKTYPNSRIPKMLDTDNVLAWVLPTEDYVRYRDVTRGGADYDIGVGKAGVGRCYVVSSDRLAILLSRSPEEMEEIQPMRAPAFLRSVR